MEKTHVLKKPRVFYGYWIVLTAFLLMLVNSGCGYYAFSLYVKSFQTDFGWSRGEIMLAISIFFIVAGVISPFVGRLIDRFGVKKVISIGAFMAGLGFVLLSQLHNLGLFYIGWAVVGVGGAASGQIPTTIIVSNWFKKRRGTAIGIMAIGIGGGGFVLAPIIGGYLIPNFGWRASYFASALLLWVTIPLALLVIKTNPAEMGLYPDGAEAPETEALTSPSVSKGLSPKMALATPAFWLIAVGFILSQAVGAGIVQNQVPYLQDIGFPVTMAAAALGISGLWSAIGKFSFGWLCDRIQAKYAAAIGIALKLVATVILMSVRPTSPVIMIWLYAIFMGLGMGHWLPSMSMLTSTNFGLTYYGAIFGLMSLVQHIGSSIGPSVVGYMYDAMGTYRWAFIMAIVLNGIAIPVILAVHRPKSIE